MWKIVKFVLTLCPVAAIAAGCGGSPVPAAGLNGSELGAHRSALTLPKYVIVLVQENLRKIPLGSEIDCDHSHKVTIKSLIDGPPDLTPVDSE